MMKLLLPTAAVLLVSVGVAQAKSSKAEGAEQAPPAAETTALPPDPVAMQKWFGDAVDNILTDADHTLNPPAAKPR